MRHYINKEDYLIYCLIFYSVCSVNACTAHYSLLKSFARSRKVLKLSLVLFPNDTIHEHKCPVPGDPRHNNTRLVVFLSHHVPSICIILSPSVSLEFKFVFIIINTRRDESACRRWIHGRRDGNKYGKDKSRQYTAQNLTFFFGFSGHFDSRWNVMM